MARWCYRFRRHRPKYPAASLAPLGRCLSRRHDRLRAELADRDPRMARRKHPVALRAAVRRDFDRAANREYARPRPGSRQLAALAAKRLAHQWTLSPPEWERRQLYR